MSYQPDRAGYLDGRRSRFPEEIDLIEEKYNLPAHLRPQLKRYQQLYLKDTLTPQEQIEFNELRVTLQPYMPDVEFVNYVGDTLINMQKFFKDDVEPYVDGMKQDVYNYTNAKKQEIEQYTENKKQEFQVEVDKFTLRGEWQPNTQYYKKNIVIYGGEAYIAKVDNINIVPTNTNYWAKIAAKGEKGDPSLNINYKGEYNDIAVYTEGDAVTFGGLWYYAKKTTQGNPPTNEEYWELHSNQAIISDTQPFDSRITIWIDTSRNVVRFYNSDTGEWEIAGSDRIVNNDGSASYTYDDIKEIENNVNNLKEQFDKAQYTPEIYNSARVFSMGQGYDKEGNAVDYSGSVVNGQINDIKIEGKTYRNILEDYFGKRDSWQRLNGELIDNDFIKATADGDYKNFWLKAGIITLKPNTQYTIFVEVRKNTLTSSGLRVTGIHKEDPFEELNIISPGETGIFKFLVTTKSDLTNTFPLRMFIRPETTSGEIEFRVMLLEGDYTNENISYIRGTKSTLGAIRLKSVGKNLFDGELEYGYIHNETGENVDNSSAIRSKNFIKVKPNTQYSIFNDNNYRNFIYFYDASKNFIRLLSNVNLFTTDIDTHYIRFRTSVNNVENNLNTHFQIEEGTQATEYEPYKESTLYVTAKDEEGNILELRSLPNGIKDEIDVAERRVIKRTKKIILDGSENWDGFTTDYADTNGFYRMQINGWVTQNKAVTGFDTGLAWNDLATFRITLYISKEGLPNQIAFHPDGNLYLSLPRDYIDDNYSPTLDGMKQYLADHPITLIYQLAEPIEVPIEVFGNLQSYEKGTMYVETIIPRVDFYGVGSASGNEIVVDVPIKEIDYICKVDRETGLLYPLDVSKAVINVINDNKLSFTHPDLTYGDLVDWDYIPDVEGTSPTIGMVFPANLKAQINNNTVAIHKNTTDLDVKIAINRKNIENLQKEQYTPIIKNAGSVFKLGEGINNVDYSKGVIDGQIDYIKIEGNSYVNLLGESGSGKTTTNINAVRGTVTQEEDYIKFVPTDVVSADSRMEFINLNIRGNRKYFISFEYQLKTTATEGLTIATIDIFSDIISNILTVTNSDNWSRYFGILELSGSDCDKLTFRLASGRSLTDYFKVRKILLVDISNEYEVSPNKLFKKYKYIDRTKSTLASIRLKSLKKNLFDGKVKSYKQMGNVYYYDSMLYFKRTNTSEYSGALTKIKTEIGKSYTLSYQYGDGDSYIIRILDSNMNLIKQIDSYPYSDVFVATTDTTYILFTSNKTAHEGTIIKNIQIEEGDVATEYEPYQESNMYITAKDGDGKIIELHNKDEIVIIDGKPIAIKRFGKKIIQANDVANLVEQAFTVTVDIPKPIDFIGYGKTRVGEYMLEGFFNDDFDTPSIEPGRVNRDMSTTKFQVSFPLDTTLEQARQKLTGCTLIYQLAEPKFIPVEVIGALQSYEKGIVYVDTIIPRIDYYTSEGIYLENELPIKEIDTLYRIDKEAGKLVPLDIGKAYIFPDGKGFTHPDLGTDILINWSYIPDVESTNPIISMKMPTSMRASINSSLSGIRDLSEKISNLNIRVTAIQKDIEALKRTMGLL